MVSLSLSHGVQLWSTKNRVLASDDINSNSRRRVHLDDIALLEHGRLGEERREVTSALVDRQARRERDALLDALLAVDGLDGVLDELIAGAADVGDASTRLHELDHLGQRACTQPPMSSLDERTRARYTP